MKLRLPLASLLAILPFALMASACGPDIDITQALQMTDVITGWYDAGIVQTEQGEGNKLVPTISFRLKNVSDQTVTTVYLNAVFRRVGEEDEWDSNAARGIGPDGIAPGQATEPLVIRADLGYTGIEPRLQMLQNRNFIDARVEIYGKYHAHQWVKLGEHTIERQLLTK